MPTPPDSEYPVFVKRGDARAEVDRLLAELRLSAEAAGLHKYFHVTKADQTVVMLTRRDSPLANSIRGRQGWAEPMEGG